MILVLDNYDSFTYNIVQSLQRLGNEEVKVIRSKEISVEEIKKLEPSHLVIGPGPGRPCDAGVSVDAIKYFAGKIPVLGVCLGHQAIGEAFGAEIVQAKKICHGVVEEMDLDGKGLFRIVGKKASFTRYHSLVINEATLADDFEITARSKDGDIMGIRHKTQFIEGLQFHPESIASKLGDDIFRAFLNYRRENLPVADYLNQLLGVYSKELLVPVARAAKSLGAKRVLVITSEDGFDEISPCVPTYAYQINEDNKEYKYVIDPKKYGIENVNVDELSVGTGAENAQLGMDVLNGKGRKAIVAAIGLNAGGVLYICGKAKTIKEGYEMALESISSGKALAKLEEIKQISNNL